MPKKLFKRVRRTDRLSAEEVARDREIRRKVQAEFPPLEPEPVSPVLSEPLREAIVHSGKTLHRLAKEARVSEIILRQFLGGQRDLRLATAERLAEILKLKLVAC